VQRLVSVAGAVVVVAALALGLYVVSGIGLELLSKATPQTVLVSHQNASVFEAVYLWRERLVDTILQSFVLVAALAGVMIYMVRRVSR